MLSTPSGVYNEPLRILIPHAMRQLIERIRTLFNELRRRRVFRAAGLYMVAAWAVVEVTATVFPLLFISEDVVRIVTVVAVLGLPVTLVLAWAYDITPEGVVRAPEPDPGQDAHPWARLVLVLLTVGATALAGVGAWVLWIVPRSQDAPPLDPARVAVLYFDDHSEGGRLAHVAEGITEALIHELAQIEPLDVVSRNGVKPFRNPEIPVDSIARILDAGSLVEGSVMGDADRLIATVQLIDGRTGGHHFSRRLERSGDDALALRDAIVTEAARLLSQTLGRELDTSDARSETESSEAWELMRQARSLVDHADTLRWKLGELEGALSVLDQADSLLAEAERLDEDWPAPTLLRARVAQSSSRMATGPRQEVNPAVFREAIRHANRVLRNQPRHPEALAVRGVARYELSWVGDYPDTLVAAAESDLRTAVRLEPGNAEAWVGLAELLRSRGKFAEASVAAERALREDPFLIHAEQDILFTLAHVWLELEDFERAIRWAEAGRRRYPAEPAFAAEQLLVMAGWPEAEPAVDSAWALVRAVERGYDMNRWDHGELQVATILVRAGLPDSARAVVRRVRSQGGDEAYLDYYEARVRLELGERDRAVDLLASFVQKTQRRGYIAEDWWWRPLRSDPRVQELVAGP